MRCVYVYVCCSPRSWYGRPRVGCGGRFYSILLLPRRFSVLLVFSFRSRNLSKLPRVVASRRVMWFSQHSRFVPLLRVFNNNITSLFASRSFEYRRNNNDGVCVCTLRFRFLVLSRNIMSSETACKANETHKDVGALLSNMSSGRWAWSMNRVCVCVCVSRTTSPLHFASHSHFTITLPNAFDISLRTSACRQTKYHTNTAL